MNSTISSIGPAEAIRRLGSIRPESFDKLVQRGSIPVSWEPNAYGQRVRRFRPEDVEAYAERRKAALRERLAKLEAGAA